MVAKTPRSSPALPAGAMSGARILVIEAPYYEAVAAELAAGAIAELEAAGATYERVIVPGALEIPQALAQAVKAGLIGSDDADARFEGCVVLGCIIRGETSHYDIVCNGANHWLMQLAIAHGIPLGNAILTRHPVLARGEHFLLPLDDYDFYLCGPSGFMQSLYDTVRDMGVPDARIRFESFGPASVHRRRDAKAAATATLALGAEEGVEVVFSRSGMRARWTPADGTLLELAEAQGLEPAYSCRNGVCGTCVVKIKSGVVDYREPPLAEVREGEALICCSTPHPGPHFEGRLDREGVSLDL